ncbi:hypothetical protein [Nocardiopsis changdeensis]|uniref:hypothetical protein n=1 Tax=Nocardiopsis changdeensis TaxID=2831969 RepID=UPI003F46F4B2
MPPVDVARPEADPRSQSALPLDYSVLIVPDAIPYPGTSVEILEGAAADMRKAAGEISEGGSGIEASWRGLQPHYSAPEAEDLFSAMEPVRTKGDTIHDDLTTVAGALETFADAAALAKKKLWKLREDAREFVAEVGQDPKWNSDRELVLRNELLIVAVNRAWADFQEAERDCANALENVTGSGNNYVAGRPTEDFRPQPGDIVYGIDPADVPEAGYDFSEWDDWQRLMTNSWDFMVNADYGWPMDWAVDAAMAQWDYFGPGMVWDLGVGVVAATGLWREGRGWATDFDEVKTNFVDHKTETFQGYGAMAGLYGEDGWMNPFDADERSWQTMKENAGPVWTEIAHDIVPWREWDDRPAYTVYTGAGNVALTIVGLPVRGGMLAARASEIASGAGRLIPEWDMGPASRPGFDLRQHVGDPGTGAAATLADLNGRLRGLTSGLSQRIGFWGGGPESPAPAASEVPVPAADTSNRTGTRPLYTDGPEGATTAEAARRAENAAASGELRRIEQELHRRREPEGTPDTAADTVGHRADLPADHRDPDAPAPEESASWRSDRSAVVDGTFAPEDASRPDGPASDHDTARDHERDTVRDHDHDHERDHDTVRDRTDDGPEGAEHREPEFLQRSGGIVGNNNPRINLEEGDGFYDADGDLVEVGRRDHTGTYIDDEGIRYVDVPESARALERYREIRADDGDVDRIAANTGFDREVVDEIKQHVFFREHEDVPSPPDGRLRTGRFAPMDFIADLWHKAETGTLDASEASAFRRLVAHEYVEARLMQEGVPYRSRDPKLWHDDYYMPTRDNSGAHDISPLNWKDDGFALWEKWGIPKPDPGGDFRLADDMSNLNAVAASALAWWRHRNPDGAFPFGRRPQGSAPGMAVDADTDPGRSPHAPDPSLYENHPSARINPALESEAPRLADVSDGGTPFEYGSELNRPGPELFPGFDPADEGPGQKPSDEETGSSGEGRRLPTLEELKSAVWNSQEEFLETMELVVRSPESEVFKQLYQKNGHRHREDTMLGADSAWNLPKLVELENGGGFRIKPSVLPQKHPDYHGDPVLMNRDSLQSHIPEEAALLNALEDYDPLAVKRDRKIPLVRPAKEKVDAIEERKGKKDRWSKLARKIYASLQTSMSRVSERFGEAMAKVGAEYEFKGQVLRDSSGDPVYRDVVDKDGIVVGKEKVFLPDLRGAQFLGAARGAPKAGHSQFDLLWITRDGHVVIVEAKSSLDTDLQSREIISGDGDASIDVEAFQGTREYLMDVAQAMMQRGNSYYRGVFDLPPGMKKKPQGGEGVEDLGESEEAEETEGSKGQRLTEAELGEWIIKNIDSGRVHYSLFNGIPVAPDGVPRAVGYRYKIFNSSRKARS